MLAPLRSRLVSARPSRAFFAAAFFLALFFVSGCGGNRASLPGPEQASQCARRSGGEVIWFRTQDGAAVDAVVFGGGTRGVVLAHGWGGSLCDMLPLADVLATEGYRVLAFDFRGFGISKPPEDGSHPYDYSEDVTAAAAQLRERGAEDIFLIGSSFGGTAVLAAAPLVDPPPAGVVALGAPATIGSAWGDGDGDAIGRARRLDVPFLYLTARNDSHVPLFEARELMRRAPSRDKRLLVYPGYWHATALLFEAPYQRSAMRTVLEFLRMR